MPFHEGKSCHKLIYVILAFTAANVASQWLELLNQDIKGRLAGMLNFKALLQTVEGRQFSCQPDNAAVLFLQHCDVVRKECEP